ncbi:hypothetical protein STEG23_019000 [Scotinomys teguina]
MQSRSQEAQVLRGGCQAGKERDDNRANQTGASSCPEVVVLQCFCKKWYNLVLLYRGKNSILYMQYFNSPLIRSDLLFAVMKYPDKSSSEEEGYGSWIKVPGFENTEGICSPPIHSQNRRAKKECMLHPTCS